MDDEKILKITNSIEEKLGKDTSATIADDIGILMTENASTQQTIKEKEEEIKKLKDANEKLVRANGNLLQQIPMEKDEDKEEKDEEKSSQKISLKDAFDAKGNFIH